METPTTIGEWADETFGKVPLTVKGIERAIERAEEEFKELEEVKSHISLPYPIVKLEDMAKEAADVCIVLMRLLHSIGYDSMIDDKMEVNRQRKWKPDGTGHGYHIKE